MRADRSFCPAFARSRASSLRCATNSRGSSWYRRVMRPVTSTITPATRATPDSAEGEALTFEPRARLAVRRTHGVDEGPEARRVVRFTQMHQLVQQDVLAN